MNRNAESYFSTLPDVDIGRSRFERPSTLKTTFNAADLVPIFIDEVLPGDTFQMKVSSVIRMSTPLWPTMDNAFADIYFFYVPNRLLWSHWKELNGENNSSYWTQPVEYQVPTVRAPSGGWIKGTIADYFGIPTQVDLFDVNALPFRAYVKIWNDWFRDQNVMAPAFFTDTDSTLTGYNLSSDFAGKLQNAIRGGSPLPVSKVHDYFTSALPAPQKADPVMLNLLGDSLVPVDSYQQTHTPSSATGNSPIKFTLTDGSSMVNRTGSAFFTTEGVGGSTFGVLNGVFSTAAGTSPNSTSELIPVNLGWDPSELPQLSVNALRQSFALQKMFEKDARGGTRYTELLQTHFGVTSPDSRLQRSEYLGGERIHINIDQVLQNSESSATSPIGKTGAFSYTSNIGAEFTQSFTEHGYIIGVCCVRTEHTYQQGLERLWSRKRRFDFYWPVFANLGEQPILNKEIFLQRDNEFNSDTGNAWNDEAFGYQEAWADYRYKPSRVSGAFRSNYAQTLDSWHYADYYQSVPFLSDSWMVETTSNIDRTLAVPSSTEDQFLADFFFDLTCTRPMPLYSIPGLIDHH